LDYWREQSLYQGASTTKMMIDAGEYSMSRFVGMYRFECMGMAVSALV